MISTSKWVVLGALLPGCIDYNPGGLGDPQRGPADASIAGRLCDAEGRSWLADAQVYTNVYDEHGKLTDTRTAYSDRDGNFVLSDLPADTYDVYVAYGTDVRLLD